MIDERFSSLRPTTPTALVALCVISLLAIGCGDSTTPPPIPGSGGASGTGGTAGSGGTAGTGGTAGSGGTGGVGGQGGESGTGGTSGTGGDAGNGGMSGGGGAGGAEGCVTSALCEACPETTCDDDGDCPFAGLVCVPTGCTLDGQAQKECQPARYLSCEDVSDCPDGANYECASVLGTLRCVRTTSRCTPATEDFDCPPGFSCQGSECVDRRVPCNTFADCPKNHVCYNVQNSSTSTFCVSVFRSCNTDADCAQIGSICADIDGDGQTECAGELGGSGACVNADCGGAPDPVCESAGTGTTASCGDHGLCRSNADCDTASGFECVALWQDGRRECVQAGGACDQITDCPLQQVCAAPRSGNPPSCQAGTAP